MRARHLAELDQHARGPGQVGAGLLQDAGKARQHVEQQKEDDRTAHAQQHQRVDQRRDEPRAQRVHPGQVARMLGQRGGQLAGASRWPRRWRRSARRRPAAAGAVRRTAAGPARSAPMTPSSAARTPGWPSFSRSVFSASSSAMPASSSTASSWLNSCSGKRALRRHRCRWFTSTTTLVALPAHVAAARPARQPPQRGRALPRVRC